MKKKQKKFLDEIGTNLAEHAVLMFIASFVLIMFTSIPPLSVAALAFALPTGLYLVAKVIHYFSIWRIADGKRRRDQNGHKVKVYSQAW